MIDDYGEGLYSDLMFYYRVDLAEVIKGNGPAPSLVVALVKRLPPDSLTMSLIQGDPELFGWSHERDLLTSILDAINLNTLASGNWAKKPPEIPLAYRPRSLTEEDAPSSPNEKPAEKVSVASLWSSLRKGV